MGVETCRTGSTAAAFVPPSPPCAELLWHANGTTS
jgi:hypothetical protein